MSRPCEVCNKTSEFCLNGTYFDHHEEEVISICIDCLVQGKSVVEFPSYLYDRLRDEIQKFKHELDEDKIKQKMRTIFSELEKTLPVPWLQYNDWPVCCGDFMVYSGELERDDLDSQASDGNGKELLARMLDDKTKNQIESIECLWEDMGYYSILYQFYCPTCKRQTVIIQSF